MSRAGATLELADARRAGFYNIGEAARESGVSAKMIRYYESLGLLKAARRTNAGYRIYDEHDIHTLTFVRRRTSADVRRIAQRHIVELDEKIGELQGMRRALEQLVQHCHGDLRPECPILDDLAGASQRRG
jgi:DNA-binding transcriptional MerR regulator